MTRTAGSSFPGQSDSPDDLPPHDRHTIFDVTQHKPEALARKRRNGGIVSRHRLAAGGKAACTLDECVRDGDPATERSLAYASGLCCANAGFWDGQSDSPDDLPPHDRHTIFDVTQHKPEALARKRRNGGIVSLHRLAAGGKAACTLDECVRGGDPATERPLAYASGLCCANAGVWDGQSDLPDDLPPHYRRSL